MAKFEHVFQVRASVDENGKLVLKLKDEGGEMIARNVRTGAGVIREYDFELGSSEFEDDEKLLRKQRKVIKELLNKKFDTVRTKVKV